MFGPPPDIDPVKVGIDRGRKVHHTLHQLDENDLDPESMLGHAELEQYIRQWQTFIRPGDTFLALERPLYGTLRGIDYIVRPDRVIQRGSKVLIADIKTKSKVGRAPDEKERQKHALEVAAQAFAVAQRIGPLADWCGCVYLWPHKSQIVGYNGAEHLDAFGDLLSRWADSRPKAEAQGASQ
jgi:hypothetical protein